MDQADEGWDDFLASLGAVPPEDEIAERGSSADMPLSDAALVDLGAASQNDAALASDPFADLDVSQSIVEHELPEADGIVSAHTQAVSPGSEAFTHALGPSGSAQQHPVHQSAEADEASAQHPSDSGRSDAVAGGLSHRSVLGQGQATPHQIGEVSEPATHALQFHDLSPAAASGMESHEQGPHTSIDSDHHCGLIAIIARGSTDSDHHGETPDQGSMAYQGPEGTPDEEWSAAAGMAPAGQAVALDQHSEEALQEEPVETMLTQPSQASEAQELASEAAAAAKEPAVDSAAKANQAHGEVAAGGGTPQADGAPATAPASAPPSGPPTTEQVTAPVGALAQRDAAGADGAGGAGAAGGDVAGANIAGEATAAGGDMAELAAGDPAGPAPGHPAESEVWDAAGPSHPLAAAAATAMDDGSTPGSVKLQAGPPIAAEPAAAEPAADPDRGAPPPEDHSAVTAPADSAVEAALADSHSSASTSNAYAPAGPEEVDTTGDAPAEAEGPPAEGSAQVEAAQEPQHATPHGHETEGTHDAADDGGHGLHRLEGPVPLELLLESDEPQARPGSDDAFAVVLRAAVAASAQRCVGEWPSRGRPDPVRQHCMLGGQLSLEVASHPVATGTRHALTASAAAPVGWDHSAEQGGGAVARCEVVAAGYANGAVELLFDTGQGIQPLPLPMRDKAATPVTSLCFFAPHHGCPMWLLAAAHAGSDGRVRVFDLTDALPRLPPPRSTQHKPVDPAVIMAGVAERSRSVGYEVVHLFRHYVRRTPHSGASPVTGCQLFVAAGEVPLGVGPDSMQLRAIACRASPLKMLMSVTLHDHAVLHEPVSVYTGRFDPSESCEVVDTRMAGTWRSVHSMPCLLRTLAPAEAPPTEPLAAFGSPTADRTHAAPDAAADPLQELLAVVALDDVHVCRLVNRDNKAHNAALRLSRLFSLGIGRGAWGGLGCAAWAPRATESRHRFPLVPTASSPTPPPSEPPLLAAAYLAASWNRTICIYAVPPKVSASAPSPSDVKTCLAPQLVSTFSLQPDEVAAQLLWLRTVSGRLKLAVAAIPALPSPDASGTRGAAAIILPTLYLFDVRSGACEEVLELSAVMPEAPPQSPLAAALARMTPDALPALEAHAARIAADLNAGRTTAESVYRAARGAVLRVADVATAAGFHSLGDEKIVAALPDTTGAPHALALHFASHLSWRAQADVLEAIAADAGSGGVGRWELCLKHACSHWLRLDAAAARAAVAAEEAAAIHGRIAAQVAAVADCLEGAVEAAAADAEARRLLRAAVGSGSPLVAWQPTTAAAATHPGLRQLAAFAALVALLVTCRPYPGAAAAADIAQRAFGRLRLLGFRPACVLEARRVLRAGLQPQLPPYFIDDAVAVVLGAHATPAQADAGAAHRRCALQGIFLCIHDPAATDINRLVAACRDNHLWEGLIHAARLVRQPLLPAHDMLAAAVPAAGPDADANGAAWLLCYIRACMLREGTRGGGPPEEDAYTAQMGMLAFLLWTDVLYFQDAVPPTVAKQLQDPHPVLQLLLAHDAAAVVAAFEALPLLADGAYCATDDVAAAVAPLGLPDLLRRAPHPVLTLRQAVVDAFAALLLSQHGRSTLAATTAAGWSAAHSALRFVCRQVARSPPAVVTPEFAAACILRLCAAEGVEAEAGKQQRLLVALITAATVEGGAEGEAAARLEPAVVAMEEARLWAPAALLHGRLGSLEGEMRCRLRHCREVLRAFSDFESARAAAADAGMLTAAQHAAAARFHDLLQRPAAAGEGGRGSMETGQEMARELRKLLQQLLDSLGRTLQGPRPRGGRPGAAATRVLGACAVELCQLEAEYCRVAGTEEGSMRAADMVLVNLPPQQATAALLSECWAERGLQHEQFMVLRHVVDMAAARSATGPASELAGACQVVARDTEVQHAFLSRCCELDPGRVVPSLQALHIAATPAVLRVLRDHGALDGLAVLHLRAGEPRHAVTAALEHLRSLLRTLRDWITGDALPCMGALRTAAAKPHYDWHAAMRRVLPLPGIAQSSVSPAQQGTHAAAPNDGFGNEGRSRSARVTAAIAATQRYIAGVRADPATAPTARDTHADSPAHTPNESWTQLLLVLLGELVAPPPQAKHAQQPEPPDVSPTVPDPCMHAFKQRWQVFLLHHLDTVIKAGIEDGASDALNAALRVLCSMHSASDEAPRAAAGADTDGAEAHDMHAVHAAVVLPEAADEATVHAVVMLFSELCLRAHRTALDLRKSQMQVMTADVAQLQGECLRHMHVPTFIYRSAAEQ
eukprot:jgi/Ulvmu1/2569/UM014_0020.1